MTESGSSGRPAPPGVVAGNDEWLVQVGMSAAAACGTPVDLLGEFLPMLAEAAIHGRRPEVRELDAVRELGQRAAKQGVGAGQTVGLYAVGGLALVARVADGRAIPRQGECARGSRGGFGMGRVLVCRGPASRADPALRSWRPRGRRCGGDPVVEVWVGTF
jgi:hypothetical protein